MAKNPNSGISDEQVTGLLSKIEYLGRFLLNPQTKELIADRRGALYALNDEGNPTKERYNWEALGSYEFRPPFQAQLQMEPWPMAEALRGFFAKNKEVSIDDIVGFSVMKADTGGAVHALPPYELVLYKKPTKAK